MKMFRTFLVCAFFLGLFISRGDAALAQTNHKPNTETATTNVVIGEEGKVQVETKRKEAVSGASSPGPSGPVTERAEAVVLIANRELDAGGCWVTLFDQENFRGKAITVVGPMELAEMEFPASISWNNRIRSVEVGPNASVIFYGAPGFREPEFLFVGNLRQHDLKQMHQWDRLRSMRLSCSEPGN